MIMAMTKYWMLLMSWSLIIGCIPESQQLVIKSVKVPATVKIGEVDHVILDCDYKLENTSGHGLVVKWFFESQLVYQWIYGHKPLATEPAEKYVDLTYKASNDPYTEYRAMKLNKPGIDLTGEYMCVISTFEDEKTENATMVVYTTGETFDFEYTRKTMKDDKDGLEATCMAEGLYPLPTLDISVKDIPDKQAIKPTVTQREDGLYDILSRIELLDEELPEATATLECTLGIPRANFRMSQMTVYNSGTATTTSATAIPQHEMEALNNLNPDNGGVSATISGRSVYKSILFISECIEMARATLYKVSELYADRILGIEPNYSVALLLCCLRCRMLIIESSHPFC